MSHHPSERFQFTTEVGETGAFPPDSSISLTTAVKVEATWRIEKFILECGGVTPLHFAQDASAGINLAHSTFGLE